MLTPQKGKEDYKKKKQVETFGSSYNKQFIMTDWQQHKQ